VTPALVAAKLALGPILLPQARHVRRTALRLPEAPGARSGLVGEGAPLLRVLVVGDSSAAGVGVADQAQALALPLAHRLHETIHAPVGWQLVARSGVDTREALALVAASELAPADVLVTVLGVNDATGQTTPSDYLKRMTSLVAAVRERTGARWTVCCGLPPMRLLTAMPHPLRWYLGRCSDVLDGALQHWAAQQGHGFLSLRFTADPAFLADDGFHPAPALYPHWAARLADLIAGERASWSRA
jgi:lysophospholipase L1-like esterase